jgi:hypothetical protein
MVPTDEARELSQIIDIGVHSGPKPSTGRVSESSLIVGVQCDPVFAQIATGHGKGVAVIVETVERYDHGLGVTAFRQPGSHR